MNIKFNDLILANIRNEDILKVYFNNMMTSIMDASDALYDCKENREDQLGSLLKVNSACLTSIKICNEAMKFLREIKDSNNETSN